MIKRVSLVWKKADLSDDAFRSLWLGDHAELAKQLKGLREYVIDFMNDAEPNQVSGIAVLRFDDRAALDEAFSDEELRQALFETRDQFAEHVEVFFVDECRVFEMHKEGF